VYDSETDDEDAANRERFSISFRRRSTFGGKWEAPVAAVAAAVFSREYSDEEAMAAGAESGVRPIG
jgi:hypothetical protein